MGVPGQPLTLSHSDGFPLQHTHAYAVVLGPAERIDALLTVQEGQAPVLALAEGKWRRILGIISASTGTVPVAEMLPLALPAKAPDRVHELRLTGGMANCDWGINGQRFDVTNSFDYSFGSRIGGLVSACG